MLDRLPLGAVQVGEQPLDAVRARRGRRPGALDGLLRGVGLGDRSHPAQDIRGSGGRRDSEPLSRRPKSVPRLGRKLVDRRVRLLLASLDLGEAPLEPGDSLRERLDRLGDRIREVDPVGVGALDRLALDPHRVPGVADHRRAGRDVLDHDRVGAHLGPVADRDRSEQLRPGADRHVVAEGRVALAALEPGSAERHALVEGDPLADLCRLADHHPGAVVDEEVAADPCRRVDLDPGDRAADVGDRHRRQRHLGLVKDVGHPVGEDRLHPGPAGEDLDRGGAPGRRIAISRGGDVGANLADHPAQCAQAQHARLRGQRMAGTCSARRSRRRSSPPAFPPAPAWRRPRGRP